MKYGSKTASNTLIGIEKRFRRVQIVETGPKTGQPSWTTAGNRRVVCIEPSWGTACAAVCHVVEAKRATLCSARRVEARVTFRFGSTAAKGYWGGLVVGPQFTGLGRKCLGCRPVRLDRGSSLRLVQLNCGFWVDWGLAAVVRPRFHGLDLDWFEPRSGYSVRADPDPMDPSSLPDFCAIFWCIFSLLPVAFPLPISVLFLPFPLCLSSLFSSSKFCGLKVPITQI